MRQLTVIAVDWSGARGEGPHPGIWVTAMRDHTVLLDRGSWTRTEAIDFVRAAEPPVVAGFDFSFGLPAWFAGELGCRTIEDVWQRAARDGEQWLAPTYPFWRDRCDVAVARRFRQCETRLRVDGYTPKSVFQLVGNGQVGAGSVRGMPHLARLRAGGFAIWPFDGARDRLALEIYPSLYRHLSPRAMEGHWQNTHRRDATVGALAMSKQPSEIVHLRSATDPITRLEGNIWHPPRAGPV